MDLRNLSNRSRIDGLAAGYRFRLLPDQRIEGTYVRIGVFAGCSLAAYDEDSLERFDAAARPITTVECERHRPSGDSARSKPKNASVSQLFRRQTNTR